MLCHTQFFSSFLTKRWKDITTLGLTSGSFTTNALRTIGRITRSSLIYNVYRDFCLIHLWYSWLIYAIILPDHGNKQIFSKLMHRQKINGLTLSYLSCDDCVSAVSSLVGMKTHPALSHRINVRKLWLIHKFKMLQVYRQPRPYSWWCPGKRLEERALLFVHFLLIFNYL